MTFYSFSGSLPSQALHRTRGAGAKLKQGVLRAGTTLGGHFDPGDMGDTQGSTIPPKQAETFPWPAAIKLPFSPCTNVLGHARYRYRSSGMF